MSLISGIISLFSKSDKAVDTGLDLMKRGTDGIDALFHTKEEKAKLLFKWGEMALEHTKASLGESSQRSLSRRYLAWGSFALGGFLTLYALMMKTAAALWASMADKLNEVAVFSIELLKIWWPIILAAGVFYFGAHLLRSTKS